MTNLKDKLKNLSIKTKLTLAGLGLATLVGTFGGNQGGFAPFSNKKVGTWGGINIGAYTEFQPESKFYGISLSLVNNVKDKDQNSKFYGAQIGIGNVADSLTGAQIGIGNVADSLTGVQIGVVNVADYLTGVQIGVGNFANYLTGAQIGVVNEADYLTGVQIGVGNENQKGWSFLLNFGNEINKSEEYK